MDSSVDLTPAGRRVAFFLRDLDGGGAERAIVALAGEVAQYGFEVDLVVGDAHSDYRDEVSAAVNLVAFQTRSPLREFVRLAGYLRRRKPDVIMSALDLANIMTVMAAKLVFYQGRTVVSQRAVIDATLRELGPARRFVTWLLMRLCFPRADAVISNSHWAATEMSTVLRVPAHRVRTIHNAVDIDRIVGLAAGGADDSPSTKARAPLIVSVGSLTKRKDMGSLIKAFAIVRRRRAAELAILGKGPERPMLEAMISELGLRESVHLLGFDVNPYKWMAAAAVFVSSSTEEGFPNVIAEALALGRSVVATDCPGDTAELLGRGKWGRLVPVGDAEQMAAAILAALDDPNPPVGRSPVGHFSPRKIASAYLDVLLPDFPRPALAPSGSA